MNEYRTIARMGWIIGICIILIPFSITALAGIAPGVALALIGSTLLIEYGAVLPGLALGVHPVLLVVVMTSIASGVILFSLDWEGKKCKDPF